MLMRQRHTYTRVMVIERMRQPGTGPCTMFFFFFFPATRDTLDGAILEHAVTRIIPVIFSSPSSQIVYTLS